MGTKIALIGCFYIISQKPELQAETGNKKIS